MNMSGRKTVCPQGTPTNEFQVACEYKEKVYNPSLGFTGHFKITLGFISGILLKVIFSLFNWMHIYFPIINLIQGITLY